MSIALGIERLAALVLLLTSLSHVTAPSAWRRLFERIGESAAPGLALAAIHLPLGLMIVAFHNLWQGPAVLFTLIGWALTLKGALYLLFPKVARRALAIAGESEQAEHRYQLAGVILTPLAAVLMWIAWV
ncbi:MAG TPA: hypothetical protein VNJ05_07715 [Sphingomicrobium sp.]|nr:hypothetical protein [Sphingomicrobium sp.]